MQGLLAQDPVLADVAQRLCLFLDEQDSEAARATLRELRTHVAETYRIHRRMLRARRQTLAAQGLGASRSEKALEHELDDEYFTRVWRTLEEFRITVAAGGDQSQPDRWMARYLELAEAIPASREMAIGVIHELLSDEGTGQPQRGLLEQLKEQLQRLDPTLARDVLVLEALKNLFSHNRDQAKFVIFCSSADAAEVLNARLREEWQDVPLALVTENMDSDCIEDQVWTFREEENCRVMVCDATMEEGRNLQFADGLIFYDLPFDPMRLEQRIGRLDRIDRVETVPIKAIVSLDDESLAPDAAWYRVLVDGFGLFQSSLADLQLLIDQEMPRLKRSLFEGGPDHLASLVSEIHGRVEAERTRLIEQDVVDGLRLEEVHTTPLWKNLEAAELHAEELARHVAVYLRNNLRMDVEMLSEGSGLVYNLREHHDPLLPYDRVQFLSEHAGRRMIISRARAAHGRTGELLRWGNPFLTGICQLLAWDDRGRAYALWRRAPLGEPQLVFRVWTITEVQTEDIERQLQRTELDLVAQKSLCRLVSGWLAPRIGEFCMDAFGVLAPPELAQLTQAPYDKANDINLGGKRAYAAREYVGGAQWASICGRVGSRAISLAQEERGCVEAIAQARRAATAHFEQAGARVAVRAQSNAKIDTEIKAAQHELTQLHELVDAALASPSARVDTIGAYILSEQAICPR